MKLSIISPILLALALATSATAQSRLEAMQIRSQHLAHSKVGVSAQRGVRVYLPSGYSTSTKSFPVIYYLNSFGENETEPFANHDAKAVLDQAMADGTIGEVIVVTADFTTPMGTSWYVNSTATGDWEDFMVRELVPHIDATYRTLATSSSRGVAGDRMGGYGAIRFGMAHPDVFGSVYALHPVGTGSGVQTMLERPNWDIMHGARQEDDVRADIFSQIFTTIFQAHLPNPAKPPLYVDLPARQVDGQRVIDTEALSRLEDNFFLINRLPEHAQNLKRLRAFKLDWGRNDVNYDHIISNQAFARKLDEYGVPYEAEEYHGWWGERHWGPDGRVMNDLLPFFARHLVFE